MEHTLMIRPMEMEDVYQMFLLHIPAGWYSLQELSPDDTWRMLREKLDFLGYTYFVADYKGLIVGSFGLISQDMKARDDKGWPLVRDLIVESAFSETFVERELLEFALLHCRLAGFDNFFFLKGERYSQVMQAANAAEDHAAMAQP
jgi:hypothetical protein